jgi:polysaccharide biosynthesis transport protein
MTREHVFKTAEEIEQALALPVFSSMAEVESATTQDKIKNVTTDRDLAIKPTSHFHDAIENIRRVIKMSDRSNPAKVIQFTSSISGEGKSTISRAIAKSAANFGLRVLLIDAAMRRPVLSSHFQMDKLPGLADLLRGTARLQDIIHHSADAGCMILPSGGQASNPIDLLSSDRLKWIFDSVRGLFDYVVVDSPPAGVVIDPIILSEFSDTLLYVVRWNETPQEMVRYSVRQLSRYKKPHGIILNHVGAKSPMDPDAGAM